MFGVLENGADKGADCTRATALGSSGCPGKCPHDDVHPTRADSVHGSTATQSISEGQTQNDAVNICQNSRIYLDS
ncbi:hypothetical protein PC116_g25607 [Phytophthora cactorum]|uniref:Uncharacterized protein n=1 Tax=Phytophthora cactorum TaxID=29920 RepID=A0A8T0Y8M3_9STRA|nr:hypothetical protein Pcac1_g26650 [Phytophthora cactorum]KAG2798161.1 hypothetical protein PC112_g21478 [Phytophthora cactorum]KAG2798185.1 hypothetical protein PC111_g20958 [Phytophthora cactorum]KAG2828667.1 hypothetical protein PC113_g21427 [Phytophthora cactorum]KAG2877263.1 hypothetical protein PC114_g23744 [Phytophthora cactorum]